MATEAQIAKSRRKPKFSTGLLTAAGVVVGIVPLFVSLDSAASAFESLRIVARFRCDQV